MISEVFRLTHDAETSCHQGYKKTIGRIRTYFYWPGMTAHVRNLVASCQSCQEKRTHRKNQLAPLQRMPIAERPMTRIHVDVLGPLPMTFNGRKFIISYIDSFSKWIEAYPTHSITSDSVAETLTDFVSRHGIPTVLVTDQGSNFMSQSITNLYKQLGIKHVFTSSFHPSSNGQVEKSHDTLLNALSHIVRRNQTDWDTKLQFALLSMRTAIHSATKYTPATIIYGRELNLPYSLFAQTHVKSYCDNPSYCEAVIPVLKNIYTDVKENLKIAADRQEKYRERSAQEKGIKRGDKVFLFTPAVGIKQTRKLSRLNTGPYTVLEKLSPVNFKISLDKDPRKEKIVHVDRLSKGCVRAPELKGCGRDREYVENETEKASENFESISPTCIQTSAGENAPLPQENIKSRKRFLFTEIPPASAVSRPRETGYPSDPLISNRGERGGKIEPEQLSARGVNQNKPIQEALRGNAEKEDEIGRCRYPLRSRERL